MYSRLAKLLCLLLGCLSSGFSQKPFPAEYDGIASVIQLDSLVILAQRKGFDVAEFIELLQNDKSFYEAFRNLHFYAYQAEHQMAFYDKKGNVEASFQALTQQRMINDSCRKMDYLRGPEVMGKFYRRGGDYKYTTAELYDRVFLTQGIVCERSNRETESAKGLQRYYEALKTFIFQPGKRVDVPLISKKTAIFEPELMPYYDYHISRGRYKEEVESYIFTIRVKDEFKEKKEGKTLVKFMETYFRSTDFQVLGRKYYIENEGLASCAVEMDVQLIRVEGVYLPGKIGYSGTWNIPGKRRERGQFDLRLSQFSSPEN